MNTARSLYRAFAASTITALALAASLAAAPAHAAGKATASNAGAAAAYCSSTAGVPSKMFPFSGMNNDPKLWMRYGGEVAACTYTNADTSSITIWQASPAPAKASSVLRHFGAQLGMSPYAFLRVVRLERARAELQRGGPEAIRDVALRWGFQNASKFSRAYQEQFGERPSETRGRRAN